EASASIRVVAYGIAALLALLTAFGIHAVQRRAFADRLPVVGVLRAVGAGNRWMRRRFLVESLPLAVAAGVIGAALGFLGEARLHSNARLLVFGHEVLVTFDPVTFALIVLAIVAMSTLSGLGLLQVALRERVAPAAGGVLSPVGRGFLGGSVRVSYTGATVRAVGHLPRGSPRVPPGPEGDGPPPRWIRRRPLRRGLREFPPAHEFRRERV